MKFSENFPDILNKVIEKFLSLHPEVDRDKFIQILKFVYREGSIDGQNKYLSNKDDN